mgnify:CR=1 FL=1
MRRVYISAFGSGLGHATRMVSVAKMLQSQSWKVRFSSSGEITRYLTNEGFRCNDIPLVDVVYTDHGSFSAKETLKFIPLIFARFAHQIAVEAGNIANFGPDSVLSDSVAATVVAAKILGRRVVSVLNQLKLESSPGTPAIARKLLSTGSVTVGNEFWDLSGTILIPDLPPPYTISETNLWGAGSVTKRARYVGFLTPPEDLTDDALTQKLAKDRRKKNFWQVSGPPNTRTTRLATALLLARQMSDGHVLVISAGNPQGRSSPTSIDGGFLYEWCPVKDRLVELSEVVVSRAGHTSIAQFIQKRKPSLLIPIASHSEQQGNAVKAGRLGISALLQEQELTPERFLRALSSLEEERVKRKLKELSEVAGGFDAKESIVKAVVN